MDNKELRTEIWKLLRDWSNLEKSAIYNNFHNLDEELQHLRKEVAERRALFENLIGLIGELPEIY